MGEKVALSLETCMRVTRLDVCPSNSFLTLFTCLQCSDNSTGGGDTLRDVLYEPGSKVDLNFVVFSRCLSSIPSAIKRILEAINVQCSGMTSVKSLM